jgi:hypothetical protein
MTVPAFPSYIPKRTELRISVTFSVVSLSPIGMSLPLPNERLSATHRLYLDGQGSCGLVISHFCSFGSFICGCPYRYESRCKEKSSCLRCKIWKKSYVVRSWTVLHGYLSSVRCIIELVENQDIRILRMLSNRKELFSIRHSLAKQYPYDGTILFAEIAIYATAWQSSTTEESFVAPMLYMSTSRFSLTYVRRPSTNRVSGQRNACLALPLCFGTRCSTLLSRNASSCIVFVLERGVYFHSVASILYSIFRYQPRNMEDSWSRPMSRTTKGRFTIKSNDKFPQNVYYTVLRKITRRRSYRRRS